MDVVDRASIIVLLLLLFLFGMQQSQRIDKLGDRISEMEAGQ